MLSRRPAVEWPPRPLKLDPCSRKAIGEHVIGQSDNLGPSRMDVAVHIANQMTNAGRFSQIAWVYDEDLFISRAHDVGGFSVMMQQLARMKNGAGWQFERQDHAVGGLDQPADTATIDGAHRQFDNW